MSPANATAPVAVAVVDALRAAPSGDEMLRSDPRFTCLKRGPANDTWRVEGGGLDWIVRVGVGPDDRLAIDREREAQLVRLAANAGFAPPIIDVCARRRVLICTYLSAAEPDEHRVRCAEFAHQLGRRLRELHELPVPPGVTALNLRALLQHYVDIAAPQHSPVPRSQILARLDAPLSAYVPAGLALCHHDVHRGNLRLTRPLTLLDWEYAAWSDPLLDLASYVSYEHVGTESVAALLAGYGSRPGIDAAALSRAARIFDCLSALWLDAANGWDALPAAARAGLCGRLRTPA